MTARPFKRAPERAGLKVALARGGLTWLALAATLGPGRAAHAQESEPEVGASIESADLSLAQLLRLEVVSATGGAKLESDLAPANIIAITREDIVAHGWQSIAEALGHIPGLHVMDDLVLHTVSVRGVTGGLRSGSRIVKVMINGIEVNFRPELTALLGPEYIPIEAVSRIEVARGPLSALYGANAFLATVNIITRTPEAVRAEVAVRSGYRAGARPTVGASALVMAKGQSYSLLLAARFDHIDRSGLTLERTFTRQETSSALNTHFAGQSANDDATPISAFAQASATSDKLGTLSLQGGLQQLSSHGEFQLNSVYSHRSRYDIRNVWVSTKHEHAYLPWLSSSAALTYSHGAPTPAEILYVTNDNNHSFKRNFRARAWDALATLLVTPIEALQLRLGIDASKERQRVLYYSQTFLVPEGARMAGETVDLIGSGETVDVGFTNVAPSLQVLAGPLPDLRLALNGRLDYSDTFPVQYSWRAAAAYRITPKFVTKLILGRSFQAPSAVLLYARPGFGVTENLIGSRTVPGLAPLVPQTVHSAEAVVSALPSPHASIVGSLFYQQVHDRIEFATIGLGYAARNRGTESAVGAEVNARFSFGSFEPYLSATVQRRLADETAPVPSGAPALYPSFWTLAGLRVNLAEWHLRIDSTLRWVGERGASQSNVLLNDGKPYPLHGYANWDLVLSTQGLAWLGEARETRLTAALRDVLGAARSEPGFGGIDVPSLGRSLTLQLEQAF